MDDFTEKLSAILNNPEMMAQIKNLSGLLGSSKNSPDTNLNNDSKIDLPKQSEISTQQINNSKQSNDSEKNVTETQKKDNFPPEMITQIVKFAPLISSFNKDDKYTKFLQYLRPLLNESRQAKLDNALKFFRIIRLVPLLKSQGIF